MYDARATFKIVIKDLSNQQVWKIADGINKVLNQRIGCQLITTHIDPEINTTFTVSYLNIHNIPRYFFGDIIIATITNSPLINTVQLSETTTGKIETFEKSILATPTDVLFNHAINGNYNEIKKYLDNGGLPSCDSSDEINFSLLLSALKHSHYDICNLLLEHKANPDQHLTILSNTALHYMVELQDEKGIEYLLKDANASPGICNNRKVTPLEVCLLKLEFEFKDDDIALNKCKKIITLLLDYGAGINLDLRELPHELIKPEHLMINSTLPKECPVKPVTDINSFFEKLKPSESKTWLTRFQKLCLNQNNLCQDFKKILQPYMTKLEKISSLKHTTLKYIATSLVQNKPLYQNSKATNLGIADTTKGHKGSFTFFVGGKQSVPDDIADEVISDIDVLQKLPCEKLEELQISCNNKASKLYKEKEYKKAIQFFQFALDFHHNYLRKTLNKNVNNSISFATNDTARLYHNLACAHEKLEDYCSALYCFNQARRIYAFLVVKDEDCSDLKSCDLLIKEQNRIKQLKDAGHNFSEKQCFEEIFNDLIDLVFNNPHQFNDLYNSLNDEEKSTAIWRLQYSGSQNHYEWQVEKAQMNSFLK